MVSHFKLKGKELLEKKKRKSSKYSRQAEFSARRFHFSENILGFSAPTTHFTVG